MKRTAFDAGRVFVFLLAPLLMAGCSEELGPEPMRTTSVRGTIQQSGRPLQGGGWIEFLPSEGTVGNQRSAVIEADGSFSAERVPVGPIAIRLLNIKVAEPFATSKENARRLFGGFPPPIRRTISEKPDPIKIDLLDELIDFQAKQAARAKAAGASR